MKKFNLIDMNEEPFTPELKLVKSDLGFELLDNNGNAVMRAHTIEEDGTFHVFVNAEICNGKYKTILERTGTDIGNTRVEVFHFKIVEIDK